MEQIHILTEPQRKFLIYIHKIGVYKIIDTKEFWKLSTVNSPDYLYIDEKALYKMKNRKMTDYWCKDFVEEWLDKYLETNEYGRNEADIPILNSLGRYYKRYKNKFDFNPCSEIYMNVNNFQP